MKPPHLLAFIASLGVAPGELGDTLGDLPEDRPVLMVPPRHSMSTGLTWPQMERIVESSKDHVVEEVDRRTGRPLLSKPIVTNYDLAGAPPVIRLLAAGAREMPVEELVREVCNQWPEEFHADVYATVGWPEEEITRARNKLVGYVVGLALGVTKLEAEPVTDTVRAAANIDADIRRRQAKAQEEKAKAQAEKDHQRRINRAKNKAARKARKRSR